MVDRYTLQEFVAPLPKLPTVSTDLRLHSFSENIYKGDEDTHLYKFLNALTGDGGAGDLKKQLMVTRLHNSLDSTFFFDLDRLFGNILQVERLTTETYPWNPFTDMLTQEEWDEVRVKDSWYRARCKDFLTACSLGGTPEGITVMTHAVLGVTCDVYELWKYMDDLGMIEELGRTDRRNEFIVRPHKDSLTPRERRLLLHALDRIRPLDTIVTVDLNGVGIHKEVPLQNAAADSSYFEIVRHVTGTPDLYKIPPPEYLLEDVFKGEDWLKPNVEAQAPSPAFNTTQESSLVYTYNNSETTSVRDITYLKRMNGSLYEEVPYVEPEPQSSTWTPWVNFPLADSPDNFPGGRAGQTPMTAPALNPDGSAYVFPYISQNEYLEEMREKLRTMDAEFTERAYRFKVEEKSGSLRVFHPDKIFSSRNKTRQSTVTSSWYNDRFLQGEELEVDVT